MSETISKRVKQLENQNEKLRKLLDCTFQITSEENEKCLSLKTEASFLKKVTRDLENQKKVLEEELHLYVELDYWIPDETAKNKDHIENKLNMAMQKVQNRCSEAHKLNVEDEYLRALMVELEKKKEIVLFDLHLVKRVSEEVDTLAQENLKLKNELARLECQWSGTNCNGQDLIDKLSEIEGKKVQLQSEINSAQGKTDLLGIPIESTVLELKISGLDQQKQQILRNLRVSLLRSANKVSTLYTNSSYGQLRGLLNELELQKTVLMMNLNDVKKLHLEAIEKKVARGGLLDDPENRPVQEEEHFVAEGAMEGFLTPESGIPISESIPFFHPQSSGIIQKIAEMRGTESSSLGSLETGVHSHDELATGFTEKKRRTDELMDVQEQLKEQLRRLERERDEWLEQIGAMNEAKRNAMKTLRQDELHETFMREQSSEGVLKLHLDNATNQMSANEEQLLAKGIREFEEDNEGSSRNLSAMMERTRQNAEKGDTEVLMDEGEKR